MKARNPDLIANLVAEEPANRKVAEELANRKVAEWESSGEIEDHGSDLV